MADKFAGFQGTVNEMQWAQLMAGVAQKYTLLSGDPVRSSGRVLSIDPRVQVGAGVMFEHDAVKSLTVPTPATGQWHLLVARRNWTSKTVAYELIAGNVTADADQSSPPLVLPAARNKVVGITDDEPIAWVHARSSTTVLKLWQMSTKRDGVVPGAWALFDPAEQGIRRAFSENDGAALDYVAGAWVGPSTSMLLSSPVALPAATHTVLANAGLWTQAGAKLTPTHWANGIVAPVAGVYRLQVSLNCAAGVNLLVAAKKNNTSASIDGAISIASNTGSFAYTTVQLNETVQLAAGDVITLDVLASAATTLRSGFGSFSLARVR